MTTIQHPVGAGRSELNKQLTASLMAAVHGEAAAKELIAKTEADMPQTHQQRDNRHARPSEILADGAETVPRWLFERERRRGQDTFLKLTEEAGKAHAARTELQNLRETRPDAAALQDARRHAAELAHALSSLITYAERTSGSSGRAAEHARRLLVNKGYNPDAVALPEVTAC